METQRKKHSAEFKARVALEAIRSTRPLKEIAAEFSIHPATAGAWKKQLLGRLPVFFETNKVRKKVEKSTSDNVYRGKRIETILSYINQRPRPEKNQEFLNSLAQFLGKILKVDYVLISSLVEINPCVAETVVLYAKGEFMPRKRYPLHDTPCNNVAGKKLCCYPRNIQKLFPADTMLTAMQAESYAGVPLWDSAGEAIGLLAVLDSQPFPDKKTITHGIQLVVNRISKILEREHSNILHRQYESNFRSLAENLPDNIIRYDLEGRVTYINPALEKTLGTTAKEKIGKGIRESHPDGRYDTYAQAVDDTLATGRNHEFELLPTDTDGKQLVHQIRTVAERNGRGQVTGVMAIGRDVTEQKRLERQRLAHIQFLASLDRINRAIQGAADLEQMMAAILETVLSIFTCERAYLLHPCDPDAASWEVYMERATAEYRRSSLEKKIIDKDTWISNKLCILLTVDGPITMGEGNSWPLLGTTAALFDIKSVLTMAVHPRIGHPWAFGIHQCSTSRSWTPEEVRLFQEIGRRLADGITGLLIMRNLHESEERYRMVFENSPLPIWEEDLSAVKFLLDQLRNEGVGDIGDYFDQHPEFIAKCARNVKVLNINRAEMMLHGATDKQEMFDGVDAILASERFAAFRQKLLGLWQGKTLMNFDSRIVTLRGDSRQVSVYVSICPGYEMTFGKCLVSLIDFTERKRTEQELFEKQQRLKSLTLELAFSEQRERQRIAIDLHDTLGQELALAKIKLGSLAKTELLEKQNEIVNELKEIMAKSIRRLRGLTKQLSPPILESAGLEAAFKWLVHQMESAYGLQITFYDDHQNKSVTRIFQIELYNSVRELLINIAKHADTGTAYLSVRREKDMLVIRVEDDGIGFHSEEVLQDAGIDGFGLYTIKHRIEQMGGSFQIHSTLGVGTEVSMKVPLVEPIRQKENI